MVSRKLTLSDIISLCIFTVLIAVGFVLNVYHIPNHNPREAPVIYEMSVGFLAFYIITTTPFSIRFRNWFFVAPWVLLCVLYILTDLKPITCTVFVMFIWFYILRYIFFNRYNREFIPTELTRNFNPRYAYFSKIDSRESEREDFNFMRLYAFLGFLTLMTCIYSSGKQIKHTQAKAFISPMSVTWKRDRVLTLFTAGKEGGHAKQ